MGQNKLERFAELNEFDNVFQPAFDDTFRKDWVYKGKWHKEIFKNDNPIVLELGCGKGEYTVGLGKRYPDKNFIGIDIKGNRMWVGAKEALENNMNNIRFLRTRIEIIESFFAENEISEIWITFPDPQLKRGKKRLTSARFLNAYKTFLKKDGIVHLKSDNRELHDFTGEIAKLNSLDIKAKETDLYNSDIDSDILAIKTYYEQQYLNQGLPITYIQFSLNGEKELINPPFDKEEK